LTYRWEANNTGDDFTIIVPETQATSGSLIFAKDGASVYRSTINQTVVDVPMDTDNETVTTYSTESHWEPDAESIANDPMTSDSDDDSETLLGDRMDFDDESDIEDSTSMATGTALDVDEEEYEIPDDSFFTEPLEHFWTTVHIPEITPDSFRHSETPDSESTTIVDSHRTPEPLSVQAPGEMTTHLPTVMMVDSSPGPLLGSLSQGTKAEEGSSPPTAVRQTGIQSSVVTTAMAVGESSGRNPGSTPRGINKQRRYRNTASDSRRSARIRKQGGNPRRSLRLGRKKMEGAVLIR
jgi:hypothetical protein